MSFFCRPLWDCFCCLVQSNSITNSSPLAISASAAFASMSGNGQTCVTTSSFLIAIFTPYLICRSSCQSRLTLRSNIHKPDAVQTPRIINTRPIQPCQVIIAVITSPLPIEQPPAILAPKPISTPPNPLRNVVCASAARTRNSRLALAAINDPTKIPNTRKRPS